MGKPTLGWMRGVAAATIVAFMAASPSSTLNAQAASDATGAAETALSADEQAAVERISAYFNGFRYLQGDFIQRGPNGTVSEGVFYLSKPGKLRFEYAPPNPYLVVSDGAYVIVRDRRLDRADHYPLSLTPLRLVLSEKIDLLDEASIIHVYQDPTILSLTVEDKDKWVAGQLTLVFDNETFALSQWVVVDGQGNRTTVYVSNLASDVEPDPELFVVDLPHGVQDSVR